MLRACCGDPAVREVGGAESGNGAAIPSPELGAGGGVEAVGKCTRGRPRRVPGLSSARDVPEAPRFLLFGMMRSKRVARTERRH